MTNFAKMLAAVAITALTIAAPLASAGESAPRGLSSRGGGGSFIGETPGRYNDGPFSYTRMKQARDSNNRSSPSGPYRRGHALMRQGLTFERKGDHQKACSYYTRARQAFSDAGSGAGMYDSELSMDRTCDAQSG